MTSVAHVQLNVGLLLAAFTVHLAGIGSTLVSSISFALHPEEDAAFQAGYWTAMVLVGVWSVGGAIWSAVAAYGLLKRRAWGRRTALAYWIASIPTFCAAPFATYGVVALMKKDVVDLFPR